jgi:hypothetical protein
MYGYLIWCSTCYCDDVIYGYLIWCSTSIVVTSYIDVLDTYILQTDNNHIIYRSYLLYNWYIIDTTQLKVIYMWIYVCDVVLYKYTNLLCIYWIDIKTDSDSVTCSVCGKTFEAERNLRIHHGRVHKGMHVFLISNILSAFSRKWI